MITKVIGVGAAGNKAVIDAVEDAQILTVEQVMLLNSTLKDIPASFQAKQGATCYEYKDAYGGCGKERAKSHQLIENTLKADTIKLGQFLGVDTDQVAELVVIVTSTEGGTGSGSAPLLAKFIKQVYGIPVHIFAFAGFDDDARGMRNTVDFFKDMDSSFTIQCIKNAKFLAAANNNKIKAEKEANKEFCQKLSVLMGLQIRDSVHNIDPTDLLKLSTEEGYMIIESHVFRDKIKNADQFRQAVIDMCDESKALDIDNPSQRKLGVIINIKEENTDYIDYNILVDRFGTPYEKFEHVQHESTMPEFVAFIAGGMKMPVEEVEDTYNKYKAAVERVNTAQDDFFAKIGEKDLDSTEQFDHKVSKPTMSAAAFFGSTSNPAKPDSKASGKVTDPTEDY